MVSANSDESKNLNEDRKLDSLEQVLASRPLIRAPRNLVKMVMANIETLPRETGDGMYAAPRVTPAPFAPPPVLPLPALNREKEYFGQKLNRFIFTASWVTLSALLLSLVIWPALVGFFEGAGDGLTVWARLGNLGLALLNWLGDLFTFLAPAGLSIGSIAVGLLILFFLLNSQRHRLRLE